MAATSPQEKTEQPTGKRINEARQRGQIPKSRDLTAVSILLVGGLTIYGCGDLIYERFSALLKMLWSREAFTNPGFLTGSDLPVKLVVSIFVMLGPIMGGILVAAILLNLTQIKGFIFSAKAINISLSNLNPITGLKRLVSLRSLIELTKSVFKLSIIGYVVYSVLWGERSTLIELSGSEVSDILRITGVLGIKILMHVCAMMLGLSLLDFVYQKWQTRKDLMMTRQEVKEEHKQTEGNPQVKSRIRSLQRALARKRMLSKVPKASVVITNPTHYAVALMYKPGMEAPTVVAKGVDFLARRIISLGRKHGVPIVQNPPLARALYKQVKLEESIPVNLYRAVAKILAYIYQQKQAMRRNQNG